MRFTIYRAYLQQAIQDVVKAISPRTVIPILSGIKIEVHDQGITLTGSNSDITIQSTITDKDDNEIIIKNVEAGSVVLPAPYFPDIIRKLPEETVELEVDERLIVTIRSGNAVFHINGQDANEYPRFPTFQTDNGFQIPTNILKTLIKQTVFSVSTMETRPILTGINMILENNELKFTATDSHRLASRSVVLQQDIEESLNIVIPGKSVNELNKILTDTDEATEIVIMDNQILFHTKYVYFLSRLLDGKYPETDRLIPNESKTVLQLDTKTLIDTIDRASLLSTEENNVVKLETKGNNLIEISSQSQEIGNVTEKMTIHSVEGEDLKISFNSKYMLDALKALETDEVKINFTGAMRPFIITPAYEETTILQLILPVRTV